MVGGCGQFSRSSCVSSVSCLIAASRFSFLSAVSRKLLKMCWGDSSYSMGRLAAMALLRLVLFLSSVFCTGVSDSENKLSVVLFTLRQFVVHVLHNTLYLNQFTKTHMCVCFFQLDVKFSRMLCMFYAKVFKNQ